jgi:hypothetical protein
MTTHVFIVDSRTFKVHLEYLFAGTGAKDYFVDFNNNTSTSLTPIAERILSGMIADASRIRRGDQILFYLQQDTRYNGKFFGIFKARNDWSFLDNFEELGVNQYLYSDLGKSLTFRTLIEPAEVYAEGITEWEALDDIRNIVHPYQMIWSLIYRKLKGNRGNTMVTLYEAEKIVQLIKDKNNQDRISLVNKKLSFDVENQKIVALEGRQNGYVGRTEEIEVLPRLVAKYNERKAFEPLLQAYIVKVIGKGVNSSLDNSIISENLEIEWLGNEVSCGVGMQSIDILLSTVLSDQHLLIPIELKAVRAETYHLKQIQRYIDWIEQYYISNATSNIEPILMAKEFTNKLSANYISLISNFVRFNQNNNGRCKPLLYIEYKVENGQLIFNRVNY